MKLVTLSIRLVPSEHEALRRSSVDDRRSLNQQACKILTDALRRDGYLSPDTDDAVEHQHAERRIAEQAGR